jgi:aminopeptidase-like protein
LLFLPIPILGQKTNVEIDLRPRAAIESRLQQVERDNAKRQRVLTEIFKEAGCTGGALVEQIYSKKRPANVICTMMGETRSTIIVAAHTDHATEAGMGAVDNWSGAALLPTLFESLRGRRRHHTFVFVGFSDEETRMRGSEFFVKSLTSEQAQDIRAMINLECLGLGPTNSWVSVADKTLFQIFAEVAWGLKIPNFRADMDQIGDSDSSSFRSRHIPTLDIHSVTREKSSILHSSQDTIKAIKLDDYYQSYQLIVNYLVRLDQKLQ